MPNRSITSQVTFLPEEETGAALLQLADQMNHASTKAKRKSFAKKVARVIQALDALPTNCEIRHVGAAVDINGNAGVIVSHTQGAAD